MNRYKTFNRKTVTSITLITALFFKSFSLPVSAEELNFQNNLHHPFANRHERPQIEIGVNIPLGKSSSNNQLGSSSTFYASYYLPGQDQHVGIGFTRSFGLKGRYEYSTLFRDNENDIGMSFPFYATPVFNASSTTPTATSGLGTYSWIIGAGLLLLAGAAGGGGGDDEPPQPSLSVRAEERLRNYEKLMSLPVCSPIPPADGVEEKCRPLL